MIPEASQPEKPPQSTEPPAKKRGLLERNIPMKWIFGIIILYMVVYNLILFWNTRGE
jgi:hypothetical protein